MTLHELKELLIDKYSDYLGHYQLPDTSEHEKEFLEDIEEYCDFVYRLESGIGQIVSKYEIKEYAVYETFVLGEPIYFAIPYLVLPYGADYDLYQQFELTFEDILLANKIEVVSYELVKEEQK